ncbi:MAG: peptidyl-prolyl cis-trans isomerase [Deltaproteobacteria bacterium]|nr:MAG: peptidyl-prolyl cis-trans isomerase [Deltaproteobacteria bacterium]
MRRRLAERALREVDRRALRDPTEAEQAAWLAAHRERYARPARVRFAQVFLSRDRRGERLEADAAALLVRLRAEDPSPQEAVRMGDPLLVARGVESANVPDLDKTYGDGFAAAIEAAPPGAWSGPFSSSYGLHLVRVITQVPAREPRLDDVRAAVRGDWRAAHREEARAAQLAKLREAREVVIERAGAR